MMCTTAFQTTYRSGATQDGRVCFVCFCFCVWPQALVSLPARYSVMKPYNTFMGKHAATPTSRNHSN